MEVVENGMERGEKAVALTRAMLDLINAAGVDRSELIAALSDMLNVIEAQSNITLAHIVVGMGLWRDLRAAEKGN